MKGNDDIFVFQLVGSENLVAGLMRGIHRVKLNKQKSQSFRKKQCG
jgi:hypothetical protein